jgi:CRISPR-associated protein Csb2
MVGYDGTPAFHLFELRSEREPSKLSLWATWRAVSLVEHVRDTAAMALKHALPGRDADIERVLIGRKPGGAENGRTEQRVRFIPLPSIGHEYADQSIRRLLVQVPPGPLTQEDVLWALKGRSIFDPSTGEATDTTLAEAALDEMVARYRASSRTWRSVTPLALGTAVRRRIEPTRHREEAKPARERATEERAARHAVAQALRHAGTEASLVHAVVQREPFDARGTRAERFAEGTRFGKHSLWHVEIELDRSVEGPLILGDGRFLGLGVMAPVSETSFFFSLDVDGNLPEMETTLLARALRRAVIARVQYELGARVSLDTYFTGHKEDGAPIRSDHSSHLAFAVDRERKRLLIFPPHVLDGRERPWRGHTAHLATLGRALAGFTELRLGREGVLGLRAREALVSTDALGAVSNSWRSVTDYVVTRHGKHLLAKELVIRDVLRECQRRKLPMPKVTVDGARGIAGVGVVAKLELRFAVAVHGPLLLGRTRYVGGGLFRPVHDVTVPSP